MISATHSLGEIATGQGGEYTNVARALDGRRHDERINQNMIASLTRILATPPRTVADKEAE